MEIIDSEDECIMELDAYIDNDVNKCDNLFMFQYLLRHKDRPYGDGNNHLTKVERSLPEQVNKQEANNYL